ncbi:MerR family transcriptional regulator [Hyphococcus sp.]|uniref:MerR family transcriptional regulator n=1 Tax=Hyphococcus sp. TaxID=2038636 RepID=UPI003D0CF51F
MKGLLQIGELARLGGVSVKALRFYDDQGLLRPEHVDPHTGYRYYTLEQAAQLAIITNLRFADFSIAEIAAILAAGDIGPEIIRTAVEKKQRELQRARDEIAAKIKIAEILARSAADTEAPPSLKLAPLADQRVYALRKEITHPGDAIKQMFETAEARVAGVSARAQAAPFLIFHTPPGNQQDLDVEVCIPVTEDAQSDLPVTVIQGAAVACSVVYGGGYFKTDRLFAQMSDWMAGAGVEAAGPLREIYHRFGADQEDYRLPSKMTARSARDYLTELLIPIRLTINTKENE